MSDLLFWDKPGVGPVLKVMAEGADPFTTPNDEYGKFRFNSETAQYGMLHFGPRFNFDSDKYPVGPGITVMTYYWPDGTTSSNCHVMIVSVRRAATGAWSLQGNQIYIYFWDRILGVSWPPIVDAYNDAGGFKPLAGRRWSSSGDNGGQITAVGPFSSTPLLGRKQAGEPFPYIIVGAAFGGIFGGLHADYEGYYSFSEFTGVLGEPGTLHIGHRAWLLPADDTPLPFETGTPADDQYVVDLTPTTARMARPGFDTRTMTRWQSIFSETMSPAKIIATGFVTVEASSSAVVDVDHALADGTFVDAVATKTGATYGYYPAFDADLTNVTSAPSPGMNWGVEYEIDGTEIEFRNGTSIDVDVRYVVFADDGLAPTTGDGPTVWWGDDYQQVRRPGASDEPSHADILIDTRWAYLPIVAEGWLPLSEFADTPTANNERWIHGTHKASVSWDNPNGTFKPLVRFALQYRDWLYRWPGGPQAWFTLYGGGRAIEVSPNPNDPFVDWLTSIINGSRPKQTRTTPQTRQSAFCRFTDTTADFYLSPDQSDFYRFNTGGGVNPGWRNQNDDRTSFEPLGIRYYVFAIPTS